MMFLELRYRDCVIDLNIALLVILCILMGYRFMQCNGLYLLQKNSLMNSNVIIISVYKYLECNLKLFWLRQLAVVRFSSNAHVLGAMGS